MRNVNSFGSYKAFLKTLSILLKTDTKVNPQKSKTVPRRVYFKKEVSAYKRIKSLKLVENQKFIMAILLL
jgi:hypothetical protein